MTPVAPRLQFVFWKDIFVIIDSGHARGSDYKAVERIVRDQAASHPFGIGVLTVVPRDAVPPSAEVRLVISDLLKGVAEGLRCACWLVEGSGFQGAMVRGVLLGLKIFAPFKYATHVSTELGEAVTWMLTELKGVSPSRLNEVPVAVRYIGEQRAQGPVAARS